MNKKFFKATEERCTFEKHVPAPYVRRSFCLDFVPESAEISVCGLGFYLLYINGVEITRGELAPYISNPDHYCYYDTYELTDYLRVGENVIGIILGNGFMNCFGGNVWKFDRTEWTGAPRAAVEFTARGDGRELCFTADGEFKTAPSPILFDDIRMGMYYDARKELPGWNEPGFDDADWKRMMPAETPRGELCSCAAEPIKVIREIKAVSVTAHGGGYLYDFGENTAGVCRLTVNAARGQQIVLRHGEILVDGKFDMSNINYEKQWGDYNQKDIYIAAGRGTEVFTPRFTYHGFRYVLVCGITEEQATRDLLTYCVMNSDLKTIGGFKCSDETVNTLYEMVQRSDLSNFFYFPNDCPHREKNGWTGDVSLSAAQMTMMYDTDKSLRVWLDNLRKAQDIHGRLPGVVPTGGWGYELVNGPTWDSALFSVPYVLFKYRGDIEVIRENAHAMMRYLEYILTRRSERGTVGYGIGDYNPVGKPCRDYDTPLEFTDSLMVMDMAAKAAEMFDAAGYAHNAEYARGIYREMRGVIRREFVDGELVVSGSSQSSQALALYYGVFDESEEKAAFGHLVRFVHMKNDSFDSGFLGMHVIFHVLSKFGESELAYKMITKKEYPSYARLIDLGETTLPEQFKPEKNVPEGVISSSHNHHIFGDISRWFMCGIAGLHIINAEQVEFRPGFIGALDFASAYYDLPKGRAEILWERVPGGIRLDVKCPEGVKYDIVLGEEYELREGIAVKIR